MLILAFGNFKYPEGSASASRIRNFLLGFSSFGFHSKIFAFVGHQGGLKQKNYKSIYIDSVLKYGIYTKLRFLFYYLISPFVFTSFVIRNSIFNKGVIVYIYGRNFYMLFLPFLMAKVLGCKIVYDVVELPLLLRKEPRRWSPIFIDEYFGFFIFPWLSNLNIFICTSLRNMFKKKNGIIIPSTIFGHVDLTLFDRNSEKIKLLYIGTFIARDNPDYLLNLIEGLNKKFQNKLELTIVGRFSENYTLKWISNLKELMSEDGLKILNNIDDNSLFDLCHKIDFFLLPRRNHRDEIFSFPTRLAEFFYIIIV